MDATSKNVAGVDLGQKHPCAGAVGILGKEVKRRPAMSLEQIIPLAAIIGAFVLFTVVLIWEDYRTQQAIVLKKDDKSAAAAGTAKARWPRPSDDRLQHAA
jgi:hypothetical protein